MRKYGDELIKLWKMKTHMCKWSRQQWNWKRRINLNLHDYQDQWSRRIINIGKCTSPIVRRSLMTKLKAHVLSLTLITRCHNSVREDDLTWAVCKINKAKWEIHFLLQCKKTICDLRNVYCDNLQAVFSNIHGLDKWTLSNDSVWDINVSRFGKYVRYFHETNITIFTIISAIKQVK